MLRLPSMPHRVRELTRYGGFTLIELLIVVAIIAILAVIALPAYQKYVQRSRRAAGHDILMAIATAQERYFTNRNSYATTLNDLGFSTTASRTSDGGFYLVTLGAGSTATDFTLVASPQGAQAGDQCGNLTITNSGSKGQSGAETNGKCW